MAEHTMQKLAAQESIPVVLPKAWQSQPIKTKPNRTQNLLFEMYDFSHGSENAEISHIVLESRKSTHLDPPCQRKQANPTTNTCSPQSVADEISIITFVRAV